MYTGIVEELGEVVGIERLADAARITVRGPLVTSDASHGDSLAINGVCLTVTGTRDGTFTADVMLETLNRSCLGGLRPGSPVNLERPMRLDGRLGGHLVQGHVDGTGAIVSRSPGGHWDVVRISLPESLARYVVEKGSVSVDGVSLTVTKTGGTARPALVRGEPDPRDAGPHHAGPQAARRPGQPGGRRDRQVRGEAARRERTVMTAARTGPPARRPQAPDGTRLDTLERAIADIAAGRPVVVVDDADRENEGDIIFAAAKATTELLGFMIRYTSGVICVPMPGEDLDRLQIPLMTNREQRADADRVHRQRGRQGRRHHRDLRRRPGPHGQGPGGLRDRALRAGPPRPHLPAALRRGRRAAPARAHRGRGGPGPAGRAGPAGVLAEVVNDDGSMARLPALRRFADEHGLALISISQLIEYRRHTERMVRRVAQTRLPNAYGEWQAYGYLNSVDGTEHVALVLGDLGDGEQVLTRVHSECLTGDVFGSRRCDCGAQLAAAMAAIASEGRGVVLYLRGHEGRGIGLLSKLQAYQLQDAGADTVDANLELGLPADAREYSTGAQMLADLGVRSIRLLTNNPAKVSGLSGFGIEVAGRCPLPVLVTEENRRYLTAKRDRLGHQLDDLLLPNGAAARTAAGAKPSERRRPSRRGRRGRRRPEPGDRGHPLARRRSPTRSPPGRWPPPGPAGSSSRWWSACPARWSCRWSPPSWPAGTTPWSASAR